MRRQPHERPDYSQPRLVRPRSAIRLAELAERKLLVAQQRRAYGPTTVVTVDPGAIKGTVPRNQPSPAHSSWERPGDAVDAPRCASDIAASASLPPRVTANPATVASTGIAIRKSPCTALLPALKYVVRTSVNAISRTTRASTVVERIARGEPGSPSARSPRRPHT